MSDRQRRELGAFARYCAKRIEHDLGALDEWTVSLCTGSRVEFTSHVSVHAEQGAVEGKGLGRDAVLAIWEAMCRLEQRLREARARPPLLLASA